MFLRSELPATVLPEVRKLRALRRRLKLTQAELAGMLDVHTSTVIRIELGRFSFVSTRTDPYKTYRAELLTRIRALLERWRVKPPKARAKWKSGRASPNYGCKHCEARDPNLPLEDPEPMEKTA